MSLHNHLSDLEEEIYRGYLQRSGRARADAWAKEQLSRRRQPKDAPTLEPATPCPATRGTSTATRSINRVLEHQRAAREAANDKLRRARYLTTRGPTWLKRSRRACSLLKCNARRSRWQRSASVSS